MYGFHHNMSDCWCLVVILDFPGESEFESYVGPVLDGIPHGVGVLKWRIKNSTSDHIKDEFAIGFGTSKNDSRPAIKNLNWTNGEIFIGEFEHGVIAGFGIFQQLNGDEYRGYYSNNKKSGFGIQYRAGTYKYEGYWKNDRRYGLGKLTYADSDPNESVSYEGYFENDLKSGNGTYSWKNGRKYEGQYENDLKSGFGTHYFSNGQKFVGHWMKGLRHGFGTMYSANGSVIYEGLWKNNEPLNLN